MSDHGPEIVIVEARIESAELKRLVGRHFEGMVKYVVDIGREVAAVGGELHADAERLLLDHGSRPSDLWGANYRPGGGPEGCIEFTSLINIRPALGNRSMTIEIPAIRDRVRDLTFSLLGRGEPIP